ncbi:MAG: replication-associated recombination protein A [Sphingomonas sp.]|nr:replication-associated recombination protein A [Sphingomonas sp.]
MADLFADQELSQPADAAAPNAPLADRLRPASLAEVVGQEHLTGPEGAIGRMVAAGKLGSMILWGPPGTGKTSIARLLADAVGLRFVAISAVFSGVADLKKLFGEAKTAARAGQRTLLFVDEIHRFNRAQQDGFLPYVEDGTVTLVGATTENPSFELNAALLSRCQVLILRRLNEEALATLIERAEREVDRDLPLTDDARAALVASADGDGRFLLNQVETIFDVELAEPLDPAGMAALLHRRVPVYDKDREGHYNLISALHKSLRGSDPQAALYYLARMLVAGEEPLYVIRRLVRFASEDIGLADPQALVQCLAAKDAYDFLGSPEGELAIVQACLYCAVAPKSNAAYVAQKFAWRTAKETGSLMPPASILNAPTKLMKQIGYGEDYAYDHDSKDAFSGSDYWPEEMTPQNFYQPSERGFEARIQERLQFWADRRREGETKPARGS